MYSKTISKHRKAYICNEQRSFFFQDRPTRFVTPPQVSPVTPNVAEVPAVSSVKTRLAFLAAAQVAFLETLVV